MTHHPSFDGKHVVITGAASGIGRAVALQVASLGGHVHLTDRHADPLDATAAAIRDAGGSVGVVSAFDIRELDGVLTFAKSVHAAVPHADIVMNIAGVSAWGAVERIEHEQWRNMIEVNLMGPIHMIEAFIPAMVEAGDGGHLVNVSSAAGLFGLPWHAAYSASKFGLRGVSEVMRFELKRHRIGVSLVCPGGVDTPLTETVEVSGVDTTDPRFAKLQQRFRRHAVSPERAADAIVKGVISKRYMVYTSNDIRLLYVAQRVTPHIYNAIMRIGNTLMNRSMPIAR
jgi:NAD(P)-dependent dehydrogenase (short-subunit alcohol dehydrogenase family)